MSYCVPALHARERGKLRLHYVCTIAVTVCNFDGKGGENEKLEKGHVCHISEDKATVAEMGREQSGQWCPVGGRRKEELR